MKSKADRRMFLPLLLFFIGLAVFFTYFRETIAQLNNWLLATCKEGRVVKSKADDGKMPAVKHEQLKATPGGTASPAVQTVQQRTLDVEKKWSGAPPTFQLELAEAGKNSKSGLFMDRWAILGPFKIPNPKERTDDFCMTEAVDIQFIQDEKDLDGTQKPSSGTKWQTAESNAESGKFDLNELFPKLDNAAAYGVAFIDSPEEIADVKLLSGSDDYLKVWLNGELVHKYNKQCRASAPDLDTAEGLNLKKGLNTFVFKCVDITGGWEVYLRLADKSGNPLRLKHVAPQGAAK